jgi:glycosyltransferase involved in cell wall biosynthesis
MKKGNSLVSVIIPTYNHAEFLSKCLQTIVEQTYMNWEAIVVNNFSEDNTIEIVESFNDSRIRLINFKNHGIIAAARNRGIIDASGDFIAFLDSDDWWYPKKLEISINKIDNRDFIYHDLDIYTKKGKKFLKKIRCGQIQKPIFANLLKRGFGPTNSSVVVRKRIIEKAGGLSEDPKLVAAEDFDLWLKISRVTEKFIYVPKTLGAYWFGDGNMTEISEKQIDRIKTLYQKHIPLLNSHDKEEAEYTLNYYIGRLYMLMGQNRRASEMLRIAKSTKNFKIKLKSICLLVLMNIKISNYAK